MLLPFFIFFDYPLYMPLIKKKIINWIKSVWYSQLYWLFLFQERFFFFKASNPLWELCSNFAQGSVCPDNFTGLHLKFGKECSKKGKKSLCTEYLRFMFKISCTLWEHRGAISDLHRHLISQVDSEKHKLLRIPCASNYRTSGSLTLWAAVN